MVCLRTDWPRWRGGGRASGQTRDPAPAPDDGHATRASVASVTLERRHSGLRRSRRGSHHALTADGHDDSPACGSDMTDTSHIASEKEARDVAESARETEWEHPSFARELYLGRFRFDLIHPHPVVDDPAEAARAKPFFDTLRA